MTIFKTTDDGKCDVTVTLFTKLNQMFYQKTKTFDVKPTIKELREEYKKFKSEGAYRMRITTTPSCNVREYIL
jgi:hypothetical protein